MTTGTAFITTLPEQACLEREKLILEAVTDGDEVIEWVTIESVVGNDRLEMTVSADVLKIGNSEDSVRVAVTCRTMQYICDMLDCIMPTAKISDLIYQQAVNKLPPYTQTPDAQMDYTSRFVSESESIDKGLAGRTGLSAPEGKDFVLTQRLWTTKTQNSANYGWQTPGAPYRGALPGIQVWQPLGTVHVIDYTDYSQMCRLVKRQALFNGVAVDLADVYTSSSLSPLVSTEGALPGWRHPGIPEESEESESEESTPGTTVPHLPDTNEPQKPARKLPVLRYGDKGPIVGQMQTLLVSAGYGLAPYGADQHFGRGTLQELKRFQHDEGLVVDGVCGPATWEALEGIDSSVQGWGVKTGLLPGVLTVPEPPFKPLVGNAARARVFGQLKYEPAGIPENPEAIRILDGWDAKNIEQVLIKQLIGVKGAPASGRVSFNRKVSKQFVDFFQAVEDAGLAHLIISWHGSWAPRFIRGSRTTLSNHAYGTACDINAYQNWLGAEPADWDEYGTVKPLVEIAHKFGIYWGGHFGRCDGMHFEIAQIL